MALIGLTPLFRLTFSPVSLLIGTVHTHVARCGDTLTDGDISDEGYAVPVGGKCRVRRWLKNDSLACRRARHRSRSEIVRGRPACSVGHRRGRRGHREVIDKNLFD